MAKTFGSLIAACAQNAKEAAEAKIAAAKAEAQASVDALVSAGKIPSQNEEMKEFWLNQFLDDKEAAEKVTASMPMVAEGVTEKVVNASSTKDDNDFDKAADAVIAAKKADNKMDALQIAFRENPSLYAKYQEANGLAR